ncbi:MAG: hypothetical protein BWY72_01871 [Bacteroidetes bacterium ADurb.Bin416]|nr:MAG: hypothetical protein BWY72_01871 [Bacteroidetes bacterium ADurb.Bin416]
MAIRTNNSTINRIKPTSPIMPLKSPTIPLARMTKKRPKPCPMLLAFCSMWALSTKLLTRPLALSNSSLTFFSMLSMVTSSPSISRRCEAVMASGMTIQQRMYINTPDRPKKVSKIKPNRKNTSLTPKNLDKPVVTPPRTAPSGSLYNLRRRCS